MISTEFYFSSSSDDDEERRYMKVCRKRLRQNLNIFAIPDSMFENTFRLNKTAFQFVLEQINPKLKQITRKSAITPTQKLATALRFFAQGSYQLSVGNNFNLSLAQPTVSKIVSEVLNAMKTTICKDWVKLEISEAEVMSAKRYFYEKTGFPGVIGCVDGTHIKIIGPSKNIQHLYYNRKGFFSINVCDCKMRIRYLDARHPGSAHDSLIWNTSQVRRFLQEKQDAGERNSWILGDAGYPLELFLMTPYT
ncbi:putative nuclease HARBI1 [Zeugodacus cucurbitae]|uniref:putative nuclease HARBI1 n=1 Tax=Zeugodacus cucurbitae TaxID=28588 RepID=UPI0023D927A3|nr:putative nuclease HARBI1 [Zeugodacus cucurbitae]